MVALRVLLVFLLCLFLLPVPVARAVEPPLGPDQLPPGARILDSASAEAGGGVIESVVAYFVPSPDFPNALAGHVGAVAVRDGPSGRQVYPLSEDLGVIASAEVLAGDLNGDRKPELAVWGVVGAHTTVLHIFRWNGAGYDLIGDFIGDGHIALRDVDADDAYEVLASERNGDRAQLSRVTVYHWDGGGYSPVQQRWYFTFDPPRLDYPEAVVLAYYLAIAAHDYPGAYMLLGPAMQAQLPYASFERGFASTEDAWVEELQVVSEGPASAVVAVRVGSLETDGSIKHFAGRWMVGLINGAWRLNAAEIAPVAGEPPLPPASPRNASEQLAGGTTPGPFPDLTPASLLTASRPLS